MLEKDFIQNCETTLINLSELLEEKDKGANLDIEYSDGILNVIIEETSQTYVINRHMATQKIWYSSPFSGADYFSFDEKSQKWLNSKNKNLEEKLLLELKL